MASETKCCFCVELRLGSIIFSYLSMLWNCLISALFVLAILDLKRSPWLIVVPGMIEIGAVMLGHAVLRLIFIMLLLVGLHTDNRRLINVFLISHSIFFVFCIALFAGNMILGTGALFRTLSSLDVFMITYFSIVIRVYYTKITNSDNPVILHQQYALQQQQQAIQQQQQNAIQQQQQNAIQQQQQYAMQQQQQYAMQQQQQYAMQQQHQHQYGMQQPPQYGIQQPPHYGMQQPPQYGMPHQQQYDMQHQQQYDVQHQYDVQK